MIVSTTLKFFRKHESATFNFTEGLNAIRGANEAGKSSLNEGILYPLYGTKVLRDTLAETVTWGHKDSELKAETVVRVAGVEYVFTRSKSGAECNWPGGKVTGQNEVSDFAANLLGADAKTASVLMLASQSGLRGALEDGSTEVSNLMSKLANADLIDTLLTRAENNLALGSDKQIRAKLEEAEVGLSKLEESMPDPLLADGHEQLRQNYVAQIAEVQSHVERETLPRLKRAETEHAAALATLERRNSLRSESQSLVNKRSEVVKSLQAAEAAAKDRPAEDLVAKARQAVEDSKQADVLLKVYRAVAGLPTFPEVVWEGSEAELQAEIKRLRTEESAHLTEAQKHQAAATAVRRGLMKAGGKCPTCGHVAVTQEQIDEHNKQVQIEAAKHDADYNAAIAKKEALGPDLSALDSVVRSAGPFTRLATQYAEHPRVSVDTSTFPPRVQWVGEAPGAANTDALQRELDALLRRERAALQAEGQVIELTRTAETLKAEADQKYLESEAIPVPDVSAFAAAYNDAVTANRELLDRIEVLKLHAATAERQRDDARRAYETAATQLQATQARVTEYRKDLATLAFNNTLVAKLKRLKPLVTDHLWNITLPAVSNFFSTLRGEKSVVTKGAKAFRINDRNVDSYSGSTIDVLALALRVALTKTFVPEAPFLSLDEPAHGCDKERTGNILGFLSSTGFPQVLLASHDELSTSVADNVISIGD